MCYLVCFCVEGAHVDTVFYGIILTFICYINNYFHNGFALNWGVENKVLSYYRLLLVLVVLS